MLRALGHRGLWDHVSPAHLLPGLALERTPRWRMPTDAGSACICLHPGIPGLGGAGWADVTECHRWVAQELFISSSWRLAGCDRARGGALVSEGLFRAADGALALGEQRWAEAFS